MCEKLPSPNARPVSSGTPASVDETDVPKEVLASGGVVWRSAADGIEILLIHRDRYRDWTLPKGKVDKGETDLEAGLREVREETGMICRPGVPVGTMRYGLSTGQVKRVHYWSMKAIEGRFTPNAEVDEILWAKPAVAERILTYERDRVLVASLQENWWTLTGRLYLVRHARAGRRKDWKGDDEQRPLSNAGKAQAVEIGSFLVDAQVERLLSSRYVRCRQTLEPAAESLGLEIEEHPALAEGGALAKLEKLLRRVESTPTALCSHGDMVPAILERLQEKGTVLEGALQYEKGSIWSIDVVDGAFPVARYIAPFV